MSTDLTIARRDEYRRLFATAKVRPARVALVTHTVDRLVSHKARYEQAGNRVRVPWWFVAVIHELESSGDFTTHLHNGDPLSHKTVHDPAGRPPGRPPFTWRASAEDALRLEGFANVSDWSISHALFRLEKFNGLGYRSRGIPSPYLWSFSQHYTRGKFVGDHVFDPNAVSSQCGAAVLLRVLVDEGHVSPMASTAAVPAHA
jgi:lysozyme family protein